MNTEFKMQLATAQFAIVTVVTRNHLHYARALAASVCRVSPGVRVFICVVDRSETVENVNEGTVEVLFADELSIEAWRRFAFQYTPFELACALKPFAIRHVLNRGFEKVVYLDGDMLLYEPLDDVFESLESFDIVLTPHLTCPLPEDKKHPDHQFFLISGAYNGGFIAVRSSENTDKFLQWWQARVARDCIVDFASGLDVDQRWLDLVPGMFPRVKIERRPVFNAGHWTFSQRPVKVDGARRILVDGLPVVCFHFSGFSPERASSISTYQSRLQSEDLPGFNDVLSDYYGLLDQCGRGHYTKAEYAFSRLSDGTSINRNWREAVRIDHPLLAGIDNPFDTDATPGLVKLFRSTEASVRYSRRDWIVAPPINHGRVVKMVVDAAKALVRIVPRGTTK